jgi:sugar lactone lactonase YvrE
VGEVADLGVDGLSFPEGPRWREGRWWIADQLGHRVLSVDEGGTVTEVAEIARPSGLGFLSDGTLWVATMDDPRIVALSGGVVSEVVSLRDLTMHLNDMVVDRHGRAYLDAYGDRSDPSGSLLLVAPMEPPRVVAQDLAFPNGLLVTPDGGTLLVAETMAERITAYDVGADGSLANRRTWARVPGSSPDGICLDADGAVWAGSYRDGEFLRVREGGTVLQRLSLGDGRWAMACALGGGDGRTLLLCSARTSTKDYFAGVAEGQLGCRRVEVPGVGCP